MSESSIIHVYFLNIDVLPVEQICDIFYKLNPVERQRANSFLKENDRIRFLGGRYLLHKYLHEFSNSETLFHLHPDEFKRPLLPETTFSISHSENWVAMAAGKKDFAIGIDLEVCAPLCVTDYLEPFNQEEREYILEENTLYRFYHSWTKKESGLKGIGKGFLHNPLDINTKEQYFLFQNKKYYWTQLNVGEEVKAHLCFDQDNAAINIKTIPT